MEETDQSEEVDLPPNHEDGPAPLPPMKRPRSSCALADLLRATFASAKDNAAPKSAHDAAVAEVKRFREATPQKILSVGGRNMKMSTLSYPE